MLLLSSQVKDAVLNEVKSQIASRRPDIITANQKDLDSWSGNDQAMFDRLIVNDLKIEGMLKAIDDIIAEPDPIGSVKYEYVHPAGMRILNKTAPFGTVLIIYESRPDVTIEAASIAFKSNNRILLKGGKEAIHSNRVLVDCWHKALGHLNLESDWVTLLELDRQGTQMFLQEPSEKLDLIVPRGGESLIQFVKTHASCPVLVSGRGNNFLFVHRDVDWNKAIDVIVNAKVDKISACNALDKVLLDRGIPQFNDRYAELVNELSNRGVEVRVAQSNENDQIADSVVTCNLEKEWEVEYLSMTIALGIVQGADEAIRLINTYSGGHSIAILTENTEVANRFMESVDAAAVYHNASTRFTDGGQFGLGAELAISTDKLHHRGPLGLQQLVTNKWYVYGEGQTR